VKRDKIVQGIVSMFMAWVLRAAGEALTHDEIRSAAEAVISALREEVDRLCS
jgi:hypothetical protein